MSNVFANTGSETVAIDGANSIGSLSVSPKLSETLIAEITTGTGTTRNDDFATPTGKYRLYSFVCMSRQNAGATLLYLSTDAGSSFKEFKYSASNTRHDLFIERIRVDAGNILRCQHGAGTSGTMATRVAYEEYDE